MSDKDYENICKDAQEASVISEIQSVAARASLVAEDLKRLVKRGYYDGKENVREAVEKWAFDLERMGQFAYEIKAEFWRLTQSN